MRVLHLHYHLETKVSHITPVETIRYQQSAKAMQTYYNVPFKSIQHKLNVFPYLEEF